MNSEQINKFLVRGLAHLLWEQRVGSFIKSHRASNANVFHNNLEVEPPLSGQIQDNRRKFWLLLVNLKGCGVSG